MTGGRIKRMKDFIGNEPFLLTYGDGIANIDLDALISFHRKHGKQVTVTAVRPIARFGELELSGAKVINFQEKPQVHEGWINGGFFVLETSVFELIDGDNSSWEEKPLRKLAENGKLNAYKHNGFWQPMDTLRDHKMLQKYWSTGNAPWKVWK